MLNFLKMTWSVGEIKYQDSVSVRNQSSTSSHRLVIIHNAPQVQMNVEQPIIENPQIADDLPVDEVTLDIPELNEQSVEQQDSPEMLNQH